MEIDGSIKSAKARAFLMQLEKWKTDGVPREKLEAREIIVKVSTLQRCIFYFSRIIL